REGTAGHAVERDRVVLGRRPQPDQDVVPGARPVRHALTNPFSNVMSANASPPICSGSRVVWPVRNGMMARSTANVWVGSSWFGPRKSNHWNEVRGPGGKPTQSEAITLGLPISSPTSPFG